MADKIGNSLEPTPTHIIEHSSSETSSIDEIDQRYEDYLSTHETEQENDTNGVSAYQDSHTKNHWFTTDISLFGQDVSFRDGRLGTYGGYRVGYRAPGGIGAQLTLGGVMGSIDGLEEHPDSIVGIAPVAVSYHSNPLSQTARFGVTSSIGATPIIARDNNQSETNVQVWPTISAGLYTNIGDCAFNNRDGLRMGLEYTRVQSLTDKEHYFNFVALTFGIETALSHNESETTDCKNF